MLGEVAPQRPGAQGEHDVVHLHVEGPSTRLTSSRLTLVVREPAVRRELGVERRARRLERDGRRRRPALEPEEGEALPDGLAGELRDPERAWQRVHHSSGEQLRERVGNGSTGRSTSGSGSGGSGSMSKSTVAELAARHAVDDRVVDLGEDGDLAALEPLDDPELPERLATVELDGDEVADEVAELLGATGRRDADASDVGVDVEVGVLDPARAVEPERHLDQAPAELRHEVEAATRRGA